MGYKSYSAEDDIRTVVFWIIGGGLIASVVAWSPIFIIFCVAVSYFTAKALDNIDAKRPVYMPGKHDRHLQDSLERCLSSKPYRGGYRRKIKKSHYY